ncbi:hypothetical protein GCM10025331_10280 [Actinoplanes utahensis]|nr:hypothetical protein Aut01nite_17520 [Actinoplanes utahensis]
MVSATLAGSPAYAEAKYGVTLTAVSPTKLAAGLANRVVTLTGTNFDEDQILSIDLGADADCQALTSYVVTSATSIAVKTPTGGCDAGAAAPVTINQTETGEVVKTGAITFVDPPTITASNPISTENSAALDAADRVTKLSTTGGQVIRIKAGSGTTFTGQSGAALSGTFGGKALTTVGFLDNAGAPQLASAAGNAGNYWIARTGTGLSAASNTLTINLNGVSKTFSSADTGLTIAPIPTVTSLDVTSGKAKTATTVKITGTNFTATAADWRVEFCGEDVTPSAATTTQLTVTTPATIGDEVGFPDTVWEGVCPVRVYPAATPANISPVSPGSFFTYLTT